MKCRNVNRIVIPLGLIVCGFCLSGCYGALILEKSGDYVKNAKEIKKVVFIDPSLVISDGRKKNDMRYFTSDDKEKKLTEIIVSNAEKNNITAEVVNKENLSPTDVDFFNYLIPVRNEIMNSVLMCDVQHAHGGKHKKGRNYVKAPVDLMENAPAIGSKYSWLSEKYGTPYFCVNAMITRIEKKRKRWGLMILIPPVGLPLSLTPAISTIYLNVLVNVETGEVIYRELRVLSERPTIDNMNILVYDSFRLMKKNP